MPGTASSGGRNRKSPALHMVGGTYRADRHARAAATSRRRSGSLPKAPKGLSAAARALSRRMLQHFEVDDAAGRLLLESAFRQLDRAEQARAILEEEGIILTDRFGQKKAHPAAVIERDARAGMLASLRALNLELGDQP